MSIAVDSESRMEKAPTVSPTELVRAMGPEDKQAVFLFLLREALALHGDRGLLPIEDESGQAFGYYVPPKAAHRLSEQLWNEMPEAVREAFGQPVKDLENSISSEEMLAILSREDGSSGR
jgi:hypothetical protein